MKKLLLQSLLILLTYSLVAQQKPAPSYFKNDSAEGVIFPATQGYELIKTSFKRYTPDQNDVLLAEKILCDQIEKINKEYNKKNSVNSAVIYNKLKLYKRQYFGYFDKDQKIIVINFLKSSALRSDSWKKHVLAIEDGGENFWKIKVNLPQNKIFDLIINARRS